MIEIELFDPQAASAAAWAAFHAYRRRRAEEDEPGEPILDDSSSADSLRRIWPLRQSRRLVAWQAERIVGALGFSFRREGSPDYALFAPYLWVWGGVLQSHRRQGIATSLLRPLADFMRDHGKTTASFFTHVPDGHAFLAAIGALEKQRSFETRMDFAGLNWAQLAGWESRAVPAGSLLRWEIHAGRVPMPRLAELLPQLSALFGEVPMGAVEGPRLRYEMAGFVTRYEELDRTGGEHFLVLLMDGADIAAVCEASWDPRFPDRVFQDLTSVARVWRGRGLGKGVKAAMLRVLVDRHPHVRLMITTNAEANAPMLSINDRLGFAVHRRDSTYQIDSEVLARWLARRA